MSLRRKTVSYRKALRHDARQVEDILLGRTCDTCAFRTALPVQDAAFLGEPKGLCLLQRNAYPLPKARTCARWKDWK